MFTHGRSERKEMTSLGHYSEGPDDGRVNKGGCSLESDSDHYDHIVSPKKKRL